MKRNSKKPEIRKKELIDIAARLFHEKGYENVSVRDILKEVNGAPGMFYYYFQSKQDIYLAVMDDYINEKLERKITMLESSTLSFEEKSKLFREMIENDIQGYLQTYHHDFSISDASYKIWELVQMFNKLIEPYAQFMMQGIEAGKIKNKLGISQAEAIKYATFILYGSWGMIYNERFTASLNHFEISDVFDIIQKLFY